MNWGHKLENIKAFETFRIRAVVSDHLSPTLLFFHVSVLGFLTYKMQTIERCMPHKVVLRIKRVNSCQVLPPVPGTENELINVGHHQHQRQRQSHWFCFAPQSPFSTQQPVIV